MTVPNFDDMQINIPAISLGKIVFANECQPIDGLGSVFAGLCLDDGVPKAGTAFRYQRGDQPGRIRAVIRCRGSASNSRSWANACPAAGCGRHF